MSPVGRVRGALATSDRFGRQRLVRANDPDMAREVVADTFLRFKRLERPAVVVTDIPPVGKEALETRRTRYQIAVTWALSVVEIVGVGEVMRGDRVLETVLSPER